MDGPNDQHSEMSWIKSGNCLWQRTIGPAAIVEAFIAAPALWQRRLQCNGAAINELRLVRVIISITCDAMTFFTVFLRIFCFFFRWIILNIIPKFVNKYWQMVSSRMWRNKTYHSSVLDECLYAHSCACQCVVHGGRSALNERLISYFADITQ